ncbi:aldehyde dehydrogenase family protein, partial [Staphylococcus hominis]|uniref:aldehyde dehydrogenase family protein n=1 Tax=Staphylococcus hominis TaxID=1290 RepID=UPI0011A60773
TGSMGGGKGVFKNGGERIKKVKLEVGGNGGVIVREQAELDKGVDYIVSGGINKGGEVCRCGEGMFVDEDVDDEFINKVKDKM